MISKNQLAVGSFPLESCLLARHQNLLQPSGEIKVITIPISSVRKLRRYVVTSLNPSTACELIFYFALCTDMIFSLNKPCHLFSRKNIINHYNIMDLITNFLYTFNNRLFHNLAI